MGLRGRYPVRTTIIITVFSTKKFSYQQLAFAIPKLSLASYKPTEIRLIPKLSPASYQITGTRHTQTEPCSYPTIDLDAGKSKNKDTSQRLWPNAAMTNNIRNPQRITEKVTTRDSDVTTNLFGREITSSRKTQPITQLRHEENPKARPATKA